MDWSIDYRSPPVTLDGHCSVMFSVDFQTEDIAGKIFSCSKRAYFFFGESSEKRLNSVRSKFADALISRLIED